MLNLLADLFGIYLAYHTQCRSATLQLHTSVIVLFICSSLGLIKVNYHAETWTCLIPAPGEV